MGSSVVIAGLELARIDADQGSMRRALILTLLTLAAAAPASAAGPALTLGPTNASFLAVDRSLWVQVSWTPPSRSTDVTVVVQQGSSTLKTLQSEALDDRQEDLHALASADRARRRRPDAQGAREVVGRQRQPDGQRSTQLSATA